MRDWTDGKTEGRLVQGRLLAVEDDSALRCMRCGFEVISKLWGCKNPCANCGFGYPLGDCSD